MTNIFNIAGYARISVDDELDRDNTSIENQKAIIEDYVQQKFPGSPLTFYEDRDRSGYTFDQREAYQKMRRELICHKRDILIIKDFSRFSRRNSRGLVELEDLRDAGVRIISIGDGIDFPNDDDWLKIQFQFLINEMPVTDTSKKVRSVIKRRQADGEWICAAPYGYIINGRREFEIVPAEAETVRSIFELYNDSGWGYKRIANYLTDRNIPTPRMSERLRIEAEGGESKRQAKKEWSIITVQEMLDNDFYIGTLRQGKFTRAKINGRDIKRSEDEHIVIENQHTPIIDNRTFAVTRALREKRATVNYRGVKKNDNVYSGFLVCGDCGSPMFAANRSGAKPAYTCGTYHRRGRAGCTSHRIRTDKLDELIKLYIKRVMENSGEMLERLNDGLDLNEDKASDDSPGGLNALLEGLNEELKVAKRQRIRDIVRHPEQEELLAKTYDELETELQNRIGGLKNQLDMLSDRQNTILKVKKAAKTAEEVFRDLMEKPAFERGDLELIIECIKVFEDHLEIRLKPDIDALMRSPGAGEAVNFNGGAGNIENYRIVQSAYKQRDKVFDARVVSEGDPLEIYTDREGEVIFKKYSPIGELSDFAAQYADTLHKTCGIAVVICDRDAVIASAGVPKKDFMEKRLSKKLEEIIESRSLYTAGDGEGVYVTEDANSEWKVSCAMPILTEGDITGCVVSLAGAEDGGRECSDIEQKLIQTAAGFLGKQFES